VQDRILVVLQLQSGGGFEAEVIEADGTPVCTASIDAPAPHYRAPMAAVDDGAVLITEAEDGSLSLTKLRVVDRFEP
jgi:hypothetical protein